MKSMARLVSLITCCAVLVCATSALAGENTFRETFEDAFYGGAAGTLVGAALLAFAKKPANHLDDLGYGAATGVLAGAAYGVAKSAQSLAQVEKGNVKFAMPTIYPELADSSQSHQTTVTWRANLVRGTF